MFALLVTTCSAIFLVSCKKDAIQFTGTYPGILTYTNTTTDTDTVVITAGSKSSSIIVHDTHINITLNATVSNSYITVPAQVAIIGGVTDTVTGTGHISGSNLSLYFNTNSLGISAAYTQFTGNRE